MPLENFWKSVDKTGQCWPWLKAIQSNGYGSLRVGNKTTVAHRVAYELAHGKIPIGLWVLHRCDNRRCVNPAHLFLGSRQDNINDMVAKGRQQRGTRNGMARLTEKKVAAAKARAAAGASGVEIAAVLGVTQPQASRIVNGKAWKHV